MATDVIRDTSCEILAKIPQGGVNGTITQCMTDMNVEKRVGTAASLLTVVPGVATKIEIELNCQDLQEAPPCADTNKSVQETWGFAPATVHQK